MLADLRLGLNSPGYIRAFKITMLGCEECPRCWLGWCVCTHVWVAAWEGSTLESFDTFSPSVLNGRLGRELNW